MFLFALVFAILANGTNSGGGEKKPAGAEVHAAAGQLVQFNMGTKEISRLAVPQAAPALCRACHAAELAEERRPMDFGDIRLLLASACSDTFSNPLAAHSANTEVRMKSKTFLFGLVFAILTNGAANSGGEKKPAEQVTAVTHPNRGQLIRVDHNYTPPYNLTVQAGDIVQIFASAPAEKKEAHTRNVSVEIKGDSVVLRNPDVFGTPEERKLEKKKKSVICMLECVKKGLSTVTITAVGEDGKAQITRVTDYHCGDPSIAHQVYPS